MLVLSLAASAHLLLKARRLQAENAALQAKLRKARGASPLATTHSPLRRGGSSPQQKVALSPRVAGFTTSNPLRAARN